MDWCFDLYKDFHNEAICVTNRYSLANPHCVLDKTMDEQLPGKVLLLPTINVLGFGVCV
jgi:hypothetical protein